MLLGFDEYPYHQVTASFAGVAGSDPQWNDVITEAQEWSAHPGRSRDG